MKDKKTSARITFSMKQIFKRPLVQIVSGLLLLVLTGGYVAANVYLEPFIKESLQNKVISASGGVYRLSVEKLRINLALGNIRLHGVALQTDSAAARACARPVVTLRARNLTLHGARWWKFLKSGALQISGIRLDNPDLRLVQYADTLPQPDSPAVSFAERLPRLLCPLTDCLSVGQLDVDNATVCLAAVRDSLVNWQAFDRLHLHLHRTRIDTRPGAMSGEQLPFYTRHIDLAFQHFRSWQVGSRYILEAGALALADSVLKVSDVAFRPVGSDSVRVKVPAVRIPAYRIKLGEVGMTGLNLYELLHRGKLEARLLSIDKGRVDIANNANLPLPRWRKMPNEAWRQLRLPVSIDSISAQNIDIVYRERIDDEQGKLSFLNTCITAVNLSNDTLRMNDSTPFRLNASTRFMGAGKMYAAFAIPLLSPDFSCAFQFSLCDMPFAALNAILLPKSNIRVEEGLVNNIAASGVATNGWTRGQLRIDYEQLKIAVLREDSSRKKLLATTMANLVLRNDSNNQQLDYRIQPIAYRRMPEDGFFRLIWRATQSALAPALTAVKIRPKQKK